MSSVRSAMEIELQPLRFEVSGCKAQLDEKRTRREVLLRELSTLDREIEGIEARQERVENIINDRIASYENAHAKHDSRLKVGHSPHGAPRLKTLASAVCLTQPLCVTLSCRACCRSCTAPTRPRRSRAT